MLRKLPHVGLHRWRLEAVVSAPNAVQASKGGGQVPHLGLQRGQAGRMVLLTLVALPFEPQWLRLVISLYHYI